MKQENTDTRPYLLFYSYSHKDEELRNLLDKQLIVLRRSGMIKEWHDRKILPGEEWDKQISKYLDAAKIILLLISSDFLASEYCYDIEAKRALERSENGDAYLIPIILRPVVWELTPFSKIQALPKNALPVKQWDDPDLAFVNICEGILAVIMSLKSGNESSSPAVKSFKSSPEPLRKAAAQTYSRKRVLDAALPDRVAVEKAVTLVALLRRQDSEGLRKILKVNDHYGVGEEDVCSTNAFPLDFPVDSEGEPQPLDLAIKIESPDFEPKTQTKNIRILPRGDSEPRIFLLTPKREGDLFVNVELYQDNLLLTGCLLETKASQTESETQSVNLISVPLKSEHKKPDTKNAAFQNATDFETSKQTRLETYPSPSQIFIPNPSQSYSREIAPTERLISPKSSFKSLSRIAAAFSFFGFLTILAAGLIIYNSTSYNISSNSNSSLSNDDSAIFTLRMINSAQAEHRSSINSEKFASLKELIDSGLVHNNLSDGEKSGYKFNVQILPGTDAPRYDATAEPVEAEGADSTGSRSFYTNEGGDIFYTPGGKAGSRDNPGIRLGE